MQLKQLAVNDGIIRNALAEWATTSGTDADDWGDIYTNDVSMIQFVVDALNDYLMEFPLNAAEDGRESIDVTYVTESEGVGIEGLEFAYVLHAPDSEDVGPLRVGSLFYKTTDFVPERGGWTGMVEIGHDMVNIANTAIRTFNHFASAA